MFYDINSTTLKSFVCKAVASFTLASTCLMASSLVAWAQGAARPERGVGPGNSYSISDIENINLTNGNVNLSIPLASLPPISGGKLSWTVSAIYNSKLWDVKRGEIEAGAPPENIIRYMQEAPQLSEQGGWRIGGAYSLDFHESRDDVNWIIGYGDGDAGYLSQYPNWYKVVLTKPDGATHELRPVDYSPYFEHRSHLFGYYKEHPVSVGGPMRYYSYDGSYLWAIIYHTGTISWKLYLKDGTQVVKYTSGVQRIIDTNGNSIKIFTDSSGSATTTHYQDEQTGREIKVVSNFGSNSHQIQYQAVGGSWVNIDLVFGVTTVHGKIL